MQLNNWNVYYSSIQLNNIAGATYTNGSMSNAYTTPFSIISSGDGQSYVPLTTQFIDVYSGGAPFTYTQELVQRGAEVQDEEIQLLVVGSSPNDVANKINALRQAVTMTDITGPAILSIRRSGQASYTDFLIHSAMVQENPTYYGRDVKLSGNAPSRAFVSLKITRSPYGVDQIPYIRAANIALSNGSNLNMLSLDTYPNLVGGLVNVKIDNTSSGGVGQIGSFITGFSLPGTWNVTSPTSFTGTLAAGGTALQGRAITIQDIQCLDPLQVVFVMDCQNNDIEARLEIGDYVTSYVRSIGSDVNPSFAAGRVFLMPPIDVHSLFSGLQDYNTKYTITYRIRIRNINRGATRTYAIVRVFSWRGSALLLQPTSDWTSRTEIHTAYQYFTFADQVDFTCQPLPIPKAFIGYQNDPQDKITYDSAAKIRGSALRITQRNGQIAMPLIVTTATSQYKSNVYSGLYISVAPLYQVTKP
jgi:hypothetical protein